MTMRIGLSAYDLEAADLVALTQAADEAGFESLWLGEHLVLPPWLEPRRSQIEQALPPLSFDAPALRRPRSYPTFTCARCGGRATSARLRGSSIGGWIVVVTGSTPAQIGSA